MPWIVLAALLLLSSLWVVVEARDVVAPRRQAALAVHGLLAALATAALVLYVASADSYRGHGISRWEAYDAAAITVPAALVGAAASALALSAARRSGRAAAAAGFLGVVASVLLVSAFVANTAN